jgi:hypothetical protein
MKAIPKKEVDRRRAEFTRLYKVASEEFECSDELIAEEMGYQTTDGLRALLAGKARAPFRQKLTALRAFVAELQSPSETPSGAPSGAPPEVPSAIPSPELGEVTNGALKFTVRAPLVVIFRIEFAEA